MRLAATTTPGNVTQVTDGLRKALLYTLWQTSIWERGETPGLNDYVTSRVMEFGSTSFNITKFSQGFNSLDTFWRESKRRNLTTDDLDAIDTGCPHCQMTSGVYNQAKTIKHKNKVIENCDMRGVTVNAPFIGQVMEIEYGRHFTPGDIDHARYEVIIGWDVADRLFPYEDPVGKEMTIAGIRVPGPHLSLVPAPLGGGT